MEMYNHGEDPVTREASLAVYSMYRGLLNYLDSVETRGAGDTCGYWTLCEAGHVAASHGQHGSVIALIGCNATKLFAGTEQQ